MDNVREEALEEELTRGEPFDEAHRRATARAGPRHPRGWRHGPFYEWCRFGRQRVATLREPLRAAARRQKTEVADPDEALREDVHQEATEKLDRVERERTNLTPVSVVLPAKRDGVVGHVDEPMVGDGHSVRVAREVLQHVSGTAEGRLRIHHPRLAIEGSEEGAKGRLRFQRCERAREIEAAVSTGIAKAGHELATKELPEHRDREKEARACVDPPCAVGR